MRFRGKDSLVSYGREPDSYKCVCGFKNIRIRLDGALNRFGERFQNEAVLVNRFTKELKQLRQRRQQQCQKTIGFKTKTTTLQVITLFSEIQLVVYYRCCVLID